jgi:GNAT superfamily N-acetyltransferase
MNVSYRPANEEDLEPGVRVVQQAFTELRVRNGYAPVPPLKHTFQRFMLEEDPTGIWVAESEDDTIIGFGFSWMRQRFWYLSQLFIQPDIQSKGIGQALMSRTLEQAERNGAENRALITPGYNMASTGLYIRNGLYPREPLYRMAAPVEVLRGGNTSAPGYEVTPLRLWPAEQAWLDTVDDAIIGFQRSSQHGFLQSVQGSRALRIDQAGQSVGYAYISSVGHIGPLVVAPGADPGEVTKAAVHAALDGQVKQVSLIVPGRADRIVGTLSAIGFRIEEPLLLMAAQPFGDWSRYLPSNPGFM